jgi:hypothetical protein
MGFGISQECDSDSANGSKSASIRPEQPQRIDGHEALFSICLSGLSKLHGGVDMAPKKFLAESQSPLPCQTL